MKRAEEKSETIVLANVALILCTLLSAGVSSERTTTTTEGGRGSREESYNRSQRGLQVVSMVPRDFEAIKRDWLARYVDFSASRRAAPM